MEPEALGQGRSITVIVADDEPHVVEYVRTVLELEGFEVVGSASDADGAVHLANELRPDVALVDLHMPGSGLDAAQLIGSVNPETHVVIFSSETDAPDLLPLLRSGIDGYVVKGGPPEQLTEAIRCVVAGNGTYLAPEVGKVALDALATRLHAERQEALRTERRRARIQDAIDRRRFSIVVQPIVRLRDGAPYAAEALTRFAGPPARSPDEWFSEAGDVGLRTPLELAAASAALDELPRVAPDLRITVNISPGTVTSGRLGELLVDAPLERVILELTEHQPVSDYEELAAALAPWRHGGVSLAVDDAGGGYASFTHILNLSPDFIKLDIGLTHRIHADRQRQALARALIGFAREMDVCVIAEGVESAAQRDVLEVLGVHYGQGYHLGRPLPLDDQPALLTRAPAVDLRPIQRAHPRPGSLR